MAGKHFFTSKHVWAAVIVICVAACGAWWLNGSKAETSRRAAVSADGKLHATVSSYIVYALAREIGGEQVVLSMLVPPGTEPHHFEPTPGSIIAVDETGLFLYVSPQAEPWVPSILHGLGQVRAVAIAPVEPEDDPHIWTTPYGALSMAQEISRTFAKADPAHKKLYQARLKSFEREMQQLHEAFTQGLANCQHRDVIHIGHLAFEPLAHTYNLNLSLLSGTASQGEHSVQRLAQLVRQVRQKKATAIFSEEMLPPDLAATVARETRVHILPLYSIEEVSKQDFDRGVSYGEYMRRNLKNLQEGLQCQA